MAEGRGSKRAGEPAPDAGAAPRVVATRAAGSSYILPANPLTNVTDASLEGFVDRELDEAAAPSVFPIGTREELETVPPSEPMRAAMLDSAPIAARSRDLAIPQHVEPMRSEPLPLPPPPAVRASQPFVRTAVPYRLTELPRLPVESIDDGRANARVPLVPKHVRVRLVAASVIAPLLGAGAVVAYMQLAATTAAAATTAMPATVAVVDALPVQARVHVEAPPPAPVPPIHTVLVRTHPPSARVTLDGHYVGTTPMYIEVPANTPVEVGLARRGFKPVTYPLVSKRRADRVIVRMSRASRGQR